MARAPATGTAGPAGGQVRQRPEPRPDLLGDEQHARTYTRSDPQGTKALNHPDFEPFWAEAQDLGLDGGPLYDPETNYRRVRGKWFDWDDDRAPVAKSTRTVDTPPQNGTIPDR